MTKTLFTFLLLTAGIQLMAQTDTTTIATDRPTQTASAYTIPKGSVQIETGFLNVRTDLGRNGFGSVTLNQITFNSTQVRVGVDDNFELLLSQSLIQNRLRGGGVDGNSSTEFIPTLLGARIGIVNATKPGAAQVSLLATVGGAILSEVETGTFFDVRFNFQHSFESGFGLGYSVVGIYNDLIDQFDGMLTAVASYQTSPRLSIFGELFLISPALEDAVLQADLGVLYLINNNLQVDVFTGFGISEFTPDSMFGFGLSVKIPKK